MADENNAIADLRAVISTPTGRRVLYRILEMTHLYEDVFSEQNHVTSYMEGRRSIGVQIKADIIATDANDYVAMIAENIPRPAQLVNSPKADEGADDVE